MLVRHPFAGNADDGQLFPLDLVFDDVRDDIAGITSFCDNSDVFLAIR